MNIQATKIELIKQLLSVDNELVLNKIKAILSSEQVNVVAYTASGDPLTEGKYIEHIKQISNDIENGSRTTHQVRLKILY